MYSRQRSHALRTALFCLIILSLVVTGCGSKEKKATKAAQAAEATTAQGAQQTPKPSPKPTEAPTPTEEPEEEEIAFSDLQDGMSDFDSYRVTSSVTTTEEGGEQVLEHDGRVRARAPCPAPCLQRNRG